jgi:hypothetical protein
MRVLKTILKSISYIAVAGVLALAVYVFLMSGIFHKPESFLETGTYQPAGGRILVVGGTRGTGLEIVKKLNAMGEEVVVTVRLTSNTEALDELGIETVVMDALIPEQVQAAVTEGNFSAIVSTLGTSARDLPVRSNPLKSLIFGQTKMDPNKRPDFVGNRDAVPWPARRGHNDVTPLKTKAEDYLRDSGLAYTIIRPGGLGPRNLAATGTARLTEDAKSFSYMGRGDLAELTIAALGDPATSGKTYTSYDPSRLYLWDLFID